MKFQKIQNQIKQLDFLNAYENLMNLNYVFNFENLSRDFPKINSITMYMFLMFLISQKEDVDRHLAICNYLYFINPYICGADRLIRWHLIRILDISPRNPIAIREWIFGIYNGNPDCPFSDIELMEYKKVLNELQDEFK